MVFKPTLYQPKKCQQPEGKSTKALKNQYLLDFVELASRISVPKMKTWLSQTKLLLHKKNLLQMFLHQQTTIFLKRGGWEVEYTYVG